MRVAWLPVTLLLILNMATVFGSLSIAEGRLITFSDLPAGATFQQVEIAAAQARAVGIDAGSAAMLFLQAFSFVASAFLIATFMAPLIRLAGLGERPLPGVFRAPFGPDQIRYLLAAAFGAFVTVAIVGLPLQATAAFILSIIVEALSRTYVIFPDANSLHTIELANAESVLLERGELWVYDYGLWGVATVVLFAISLVIFMQHFRPANRARPAGVGNLPARALMTAILLAVYLGLIVIVASAVLNTGLPDPANMAQAFLGLGALVMLYVNLRLFPYQGVAVCRRSMAFAGTLRVTRGWNVLRLLVTLLLLGGFMLAIQALINLLAFPAALAGLQTLFEATAVYTKFFNDGEQAAWVMPFFVWIWAVLKILYNVFWSFFTFGVTAGLLGRLYRESENA